MPSMVFQWFLILLPLLSMVFNGYGPLVKRCDGFDGSLWSKLNPTGLQLSLRIIGQRPEKCSFYEENVGCSGVQGPARPRRRFDKGICSTRVYSIQGEYTGRVYREYTDSIQGVYTDLQHARPLKLFCHAQSIVLGAAGQHCWLIQFTCVQG